MEDLKDISKQLRAERYFFDNWNGGPFGPSHVKMWLEGFAKQETERLHKCSTKSDMDNFDEWCNALDMIKQHKEENEKLREGIKEIALHVDDMIAPSDKDITNLHKDLEQLLKNK